MSGGLVGDRGNVDELNGRWIGPSDSENCGCCQQSQEQTLFPRLVTHDLAQNGI